MSGAAATEIEATIEDNAGGSSSMMKKKKSQLVLHREKIEQGRIEQHCGSRGKELFRMLRSDSDKKSSAAVAGALDQPICKRINSFAFSYAKQWSRGFHFRTVFASHLIFWMSLLPSIAFGCWLQLETDGGIGIVEVLASTCICGLVFGVLGTQPLMILGVSVPTLVFTAAVAHTSRRLSLEFIPWLSWIGLWCSLLLVFLAASGACRLTTQLTFFSWEILRLFVGFSLLWIGLAEIVGFFSATGHSLEAALLSLWLATCTLVLAAALNGSKTWRCLNSHARELIHNYGPALTFLVFTVLPLLPKFQHIRFQRVDMPDFLFHSDNVTRIGALVRLKSVPMWAILLAFIPGALLACLIFVDHSATSVVVKHAGGVILPEKAPQSWDLFIVALLACACSLFGMPMCYGLFRQSLAHKRALTYHIDAYDEEGQQSSRETINSQRISAMIVSLLCGLPFIPGIVQLLEKIPVGVIAGMFLEMAYSSLRDLKSVKRLKVFFTLYDSSSDQVSSVCRRRSYCGIQIVSALVIFSTSRTPGALVFPLFFLLVITLRHYFLLSLFTSSGLGSLDSSLSTSAPGTVLVCEEFSKAEANSRSFKPAHVEIESSSSPHSRGSPSMLIIPSTRRLRERSRRRNKRKRQASGSAARTEEEHEEEPSEEQQKMCFSQDSFEGELSCKQDSSRLFGRSKRRAVNIELHSNLLYDHHRHAWQNPVATAGDAAGDDDPEDELDELNVSAQSPGLYESPHRPSPASSQVNACYQPVNSGSTSSHSSSHSKNKRKLASDVFSTTQNPCFVQAELGNPRPVPTTLEAT